MTSTSPISGSGGRLFNVNLATASGASFLAVSTLAGVGLANGLTTTESNTLRIQLDDTNPTVFPLSSLIPLELECLSQIHLFFGLSLFAVPPSQVSDTIASLDNHATHSPTNNVKHWPLILGKKMHTTAFWWHKQAIGRSYVV